MAALDLSVTGTGVKPGPSSTRQKSRAKGLQSSRVPMLDSATALSIMEDKLCSRYKSVKDAFVHMDYDLDGRISAAEFRVTLDLMGLVMSDEEFLRLWQYFDTEGVGFLNYTAFNNKVGAMIHPPITKPVIDRPQTPRVRRANAKRIASRLKKTMLNLRDAFNMIDSDHSGRISHAEFIQALRHVGLNKIGHDQSYELMVKHKPADDLEDGITYETFVKTMEDYLNYDAAEANAQAAGVYDEEPLLSLNHAEKLLAEKLWGKFAAVQRAFRAFDSDKSGALSYDEFRAALRTLGVNLSDPDFKELVLKYDTNGDGEISYDEFNAVVGPLIHPEAINTNKLHQTMMEQAGAQTSALHYRPDAKLGAAKIKKVMSLEERAAMVAPILGLMQCETIFAQSLFGRYKELAAAFREADADGSGELSKSEFHALLRSLGVKMADEHIAQLVDKYDQNGDGGISYDELAARLGPLMKGGDHAAAALGMHIEVEGAEPVSSYAGSRVSTAAESKHSAFAQGGKRTPRKDVDWDRMSFDDAASVSTLSTSAVDVKGVEARMRRVLGRSWMSVYKGLQKEQVSGSVSSDRFRDLMAKRGVPLTSKEVRALGRAHGVPAAAATGGIPYEDVMRATFSKGAGL